jgi:hypothetical protein
VLHLRLRTLGRPNGPGKRPSRSRGELFAGDGDFFITLFDDQSTNLA